MLVVSRSSGRRWRRKIAHLANGDWAVIRSRLLQDADGPSEGLIELVIKPAAPVLDGELAAVAEVFGLTPIESRVLLGLARAQCPKLIATACRVSVHTVRSHIRAIYAKLGTRSSAATQALVLGLRD
jgi:DNA-binding CsgD family transcriptional regulator